MVAVVFLDIDGVICCNMAGRLEENKLAVLKTICQATDAKVVLSTDWRRQAQLKRQVVAALKRLDIECIGATPMRAMFQPIRPQEITEWMRTNGAKYGVDKWVAIDDRDLLNEHGGAELQGHMCRTHPNSGLTKRLGDVCIEILGGSVSGSAEAPQQDDSSSPAATGLAATSLLARARTPTRQPPGAAAYGAAPATPGSRGQPVVPTSFATQPAAESAFGGPAASRALQRAPGGRGTSPDARGGAPRGTTAAVSRKALSTPTTGGGGNRLVTRVPVASAGGAESKRLQPASGSGLATALAEAAAM